MNRAKRQVICKVCKENLLSFKLLFDHYQDMHRNSLKRFDIKNRKLKQSALMLANDSQEVLQFLGWDESECKVREVGFRAIEEEMREGKKSKNTS